jgi:L-alanine-DL-glutamate epimerase-like enolase superfamily enzyme
VQRLDIPLHEPFTISKGAQSTARNVLVTAVLSDGTRGFGECAPFPAFNGETQAGALASLRRTRAELLGRDADRLRPLAEAIKGSGCARAGMEMALLDAWCRARRMPLRVFFGGAQDSVRTDVTIPVVGPGQAAAAAARIRRMGVGTLKIKVGTDASEDAARVIAAMRAAPRMRLILDGNSGFAPKEALRLLRALRRRGIRVDLFEQPVAEDDLDGLRSVGLHGRVRVAADESASSLRALQRLIRARAAQVVNLKLMKCGVFESLVMARTARASGLGLMIGGMLESRLAMTCSAHLAAGLGGFAFIDLDTPLFLAKDPMRGPRLRPGGVYDLSRVASGIGVSPA